MSEQFMHQALDLARKGEGRTSPNPPVGAVVVSGREIVGRGFHPAAGEPHAEVFALKEAAFWLNKLSVRKDGRSNEATFFKIDEDIFEPSMFHAFGCPCFVLDARL